MERELMKLGQEIRDARRMRGLSQRALAEAVGISPNTVVAIERGDPGQPSKRDRVMRFLEIEPPGVRPLPQDVELVTKAIGIWLLELDDDERPAAVFRVLRAISGGSNGSSPE